MVSGITHLISALAFVESRDNLMLAINDAIQKKEPIAGLQQQLAGLNIPFTREMENQIGFAQKTAVRLLDRYMLVPKIVDSKNRLKKANMIADKLLSKQLFPVHPHFINATTAKNNLELEVDILNQADKLWKLIWDYYMRSEINMNNIPLQPPMIKIKLFESESASLVTQDTAN